MTKFRFEDLEIWQRSVEVARKLFRLADDLEKNILYRFADQTIWRFGQDTAHDIEPDKVFAFEGLVAF